jgi:hypothetical protein
VPTHLTQAEVYADLGEAWMRDQTARLHQRHLQFGRHWPLDVSALLERAARCARAVRLIHTPDSREYVSADLFRRAAREAIDHCARFEVC